MFMEGGVATEWALEAESARCLLLQVKGKSGCCVSGTPHRNLISFIKFVCHPSSTDLRGLLQQNNTQPIIKRAKNCDSRMLGSMGLWSKSFPKGSSYVKNMRHKLKSSAIWAFLEKMHTHTERGLSLPMTMLRSMQAIYRHLPLRKPKVRTPADAISQFGEMRKCGLGKRELRFNGLSSTTSESQRAWQQKQQHGFLPGPAWL